MREIKFRAMELNTDRIVYGLFYHSGVELEYTELVDDEGIMHYVDADTVSQYTGLKDKNGVEIYEGDIVKGHRWNRGESHRHVGRVAYVMIAYKVRGVKKYFGMDDELNPIYEIIGNIYENPELLEETK